MKQVIITYLKTNAFKDVLIVGGLVFLAKGLYAINVQLAEITIGVLLIAGGVMGYTK